MVRNFLHLGAGQVATTVLTIMLSATMARVLSLGEFGLLVLLMSIATFAFVVVDWGYSPLVIRESARQPRSTGQLLGSALVLRTVVALIACPVIIGVTWMLGYEMRTRLLAGAMILALLPQYLALSFGWAYRAHERMDRDALLNFFLKLVVLVLSIACFAAGGRVPALLFAWFVAGSLTLMVGAVIYRRLGLPDLAFSRDSAAVLLRDGAPLFLVTVAGALEHVLNANILYKLASPAEVGWFGAAWTIAGTLLAPGTVLCTAAYPRLSTSVGDAAGFKQTFDASLRPLLLLAVLGAAGTYIFADVPVGLIYGIEKFGPAADILRAFAPVLLLIYVDLYLSMAIVATGRTGWIAVVKATSVALTTGLVFILVPVCEQRFGNGGLGIMYALAGGEVLMFGACVILLRGAVDTRIISELFRGLLAGGGTVALFLMLPTISPVMSIPLCVVVFAVLALLVGALRRADIDVLMGSFRKSTPGQAT